jgi:hypothetical protein
MTVRLLLLKSGEDIIADVKEMVVGEEENARVVGYFLHKPCVVKMTPPTNVPENFEEIKDPQKASFQVTLFPWMPLTKDNTIPVSADWVVTMVTPTDKLQNMYIEDVMDYGKEPNKNNSVNEQSDSDQPD